MEFVPKRGGGSTLQIQNNCVNFGSVAIKSGKVSDGSYLFLDFWMFEIHNFFCLMMTSLNWWVNFTQFISWSYFKFIEWKVFLRKKIPESNILKVTNFLGSALPLYTAMFVLRPLGLHKSQRNLNWGQVDAR